ncbi:MAG: RNA-binding protein [Candidatus Hydrogenedentes bacterium]|nr:RNA-binding protein [Candidatus Hydrogenedentota bacterium]
MNIYVGNLAYGATEDDLTQAFGAFGKVDSARIIMDKATGRSKGFGFVEMPNAAEGQAAIDGINNTDIKGRAVKVNEARPKEEGGDRPRGGGGGGRSYGGGGGGGGGYRSRY